MNCRRRRPRLKAPAERAAAVLGRAGISLADADALQLVDRYRANLDVSDAHAETLQLRDALALLLRQSFRECWEEVRLLKRARPALDRMLAVTESRATHVVAPGRVRRARQSNGRGTRGRILDDELRDVVRFAGVLNRRGGRRRWTASTITALFSLALVGDFRPENFSSSRKRVANLLCRPH